MYFVELWVKNDLVTSTVLLNVTWSVLIIIKIKIKYLNTMFYLTFALIIILIISTNFIILFMKCFIYLLILLKKFNNNE